MKLSMYIMALEPISAAHFINPFHQSACLSRIVARQRLGKHVPTATNIRNNSRIGRYIVFYTLYVVSKESRRVVLPIASSII
jgi:hypothetical protein